MAGKEQFKKKEVGFESPSKGMHDCDGCVFFQVLHKNGCKIVEGFIGPEDWCDQYTPKDKQV
jgi:hypothetical protein